MKKLISRYWLVLVALVSVCMFTACSSDDDDAVTPVFPQVKTIAGAAGEVKEFTFDANESLESLLTKSGVRLLRMMQRMVL